MAGSGTAIRISYLTDPGPAQKGMQDIATAAETASQKAETALKGIDQAAAQVDTSKAKKSIDEIASSTDDAATRTGIFASALGAFAGGLEAVGLEKYAGALTGASVAADVFSNASDVATLALESKYVKLVRDKIATAASATATVAASVATKAAAASQWLLNAAMSANPVGLVVIAIAALIGIIILCARNSEKFRSILTGAFNAVKAAGSALLGFFKGLPGNVSNAVGNVAGLLVGKGHDFIVGLRNGVVGAAVGVYNFFAVTVPAKVKGALSGAGSALLSAGSNLISGFIQGIRNKAGDLIAAIKSTITDKLPGFVKDALGIHSPSTVFRSIGEQTAAGLAQGLKDTAMVQRAAGQLAGAVTGGFGEVELRPALALAGGFGGSDAAGDVGVVVYVEIDGEQLQGRITRTVRASNRELKRTVKAA